MSDSAYRVLARKYRPQRFDDLIGQEVLVRTLTNAFASGRIAHAFLLTGIRGIGKTTTARIIARGLNCIGPDGMGGATTDPCGECPNCQMILDDRHVDVIEMDAASRTGIDDIRDIIETVHYAPTSARYKIYIIDEVHMLSKNAFNALLKTLEEPPAHVKFIFATTELRKIPITIVSRCQRFDLRRLDVEMLANHLGNICAQESVDVEADALQLVATAAEGSVRDALSLLDQAIAMGTDAGGSVKVGEEMIRDMLGMADKSRSFALLEHIFKGQAQEAITILRDAYDRGSDPLLMLQDLLEITHYLTRIRLAPDLADNVKYSDIEQQKAKTMVEQLGMAALTRGWQMLLKGIEEVKQAPQPLAAAEMIVVRLTHGANLPSPEEIIQQIQSGQITAPSGASGNGGAPASSGGGSSASVTSAVSQSAVGSAPMSGATNHATTGNLALATQAEVMPLETPQAQEEPQEALVLETMQDVLKAFADEPLLYSHLFNDVRPVSLKPGHLAIRPTGHLSADFAARIKRVLSEKTGRDWVVAFSEEEGEPSLREQEMIEQKQREAYVSAHPSVQKVMTLFPGAEVVKVEAIKEDDEGDAS
ncbi:MAG: DNA polymerase III subunit gamma/tau [Rickettsiales bacterium]|nr:DNA polymerase III subunit gamma/tau [Rickettsiales bacterium]